MRLQEYVTAFLMHLVISNTSLTRTVTITDYWLEIPWKDDFLRPLPDPEELDNTKVYRFPMSSLEYTRDMVINHRRLREGTLAPGATFSGMFLVQGTAEVPFDLYRDKFIPVTIVALDATGKMHRSKHTAVWPGPSYPDVTPPLPPTPLIRRAD